MLIRYFHLKKEKKNKKCVQYADSIMHMQKTFE